MTDGCERASFEVNMFDEICRSLLTIIDLFRIFRSEYRGLKTIAKEKNRMRLVIWAQYLQVGILHKDEIDDKTMILTFVKLIYKYAINTQVCIG